MLLPGFCKNLWLHRALGASRGVPVALIVLVFLVVPVLVLVVPAVLAVLIVPVPGVLVVLEVVVLVGLLVLLVLIGITCILCFYHDFTWILLGFCRNLGRLASWLAGMAGCTCILRFFLILLCFYEDFVRI